MKKIAILTRTTAFNFGTILQAHALQKYITALDAAVLVVDDAMPRKAYSGHSQVANKRSLKEKIGALLDRRKLKKQYARAFKQEKLGLKFKKKHIRYFYPETISDINDSFDVFIAGSDQIWAYGAEPKLFPFFLLETINKDKLKASYAVSVGENAYPMEYQGMVKTLLNDFDFLSVREDSSKAIISKYTQQEIFVTCDPVLLVNKEEWARLAKKRKVKKKYVFCYLLGNNDWYFQKVEEVAQHFGCDVFIYQKEQTEHAYNTVQACAPDEFLNYIEFAEYVLTDSFHGFVFSLIFEKQFCLLRRFLDDGKNTQNNRLLDLLERIGLNERFLNEEKQISWALIDYADIHKKLDVFIEESKIFLRNILERGKKKDGE